jgi:hypothetical protein
MKLLLRIVGVLAIIAGGIWILQGLNILPPGTFLSHSFMMGQRVWAYYGVAVAVLGVLILFWAGRRGRK